MTSPVGAMFDELAPDYDQSGVAFFGPVAERLLELAEPVRGEHALDVGCGRGAVTLPLARAVGDQGRVVGVDLSARMVELLGAETDDLPQVELRVGDVAAMPDLRQAFDLVTASLVLFFSPTPVETLRSWLDCVKPGGRAAISTFPRQDERWAAVVALFAPYLDAAGPARGPGFDDEADPFRTEDTFATLVEQAGLRDARSTVEDVVMRMESVAQWKAWSLTTALRRLWAAVPADALDQVTAELERLLVDEPGGPVRWSMRVRWTTGTA